MKIRVKCGAKRRAVGVETSPESTLHSLRLHLTKRGLASEACDLSLNGREVLSETDTLAELGIVSGDLLYVLQHSDSRESGEREGGPEMKAERCVTVKSSGPPLSTISSLCHDFTLEPSTTATQCVLSKENEGQSKQNMEAWTSEDVYTKTLASTNRQLVCDVSSLPTERCHDSPTRALCSALNRLMVDSGFCPAIEGEDYQDANSARWSYTAVHTEVKAHLACVQMGPLLCVHALATHHWERHTASLDLPIHSYVREDQEVRECELRDQSELARVFKDHIAHKIMTDIRRALGLADVGTFSCLFPEIKLVIVRMLNVHSVIALSAVNRVLHSLCQDPCLWKHLLFRDFHIASEGRCWKQLYIKLHKTLVERERSREKEASNIVQMHIRCGYLFPPDTFGAFPKPRRLTSHQPHLQRLWTNTHPFTPHY